VFKYTVRRLKNIAYDYFEYCPHYLTGKNWRDLIEFKIDFDRALNSLGRGKWTGYNLDGIDLKKFGRMQVVVIADVLGYLSNKELMLRFHIEDVGRLRRWAYFKMAKFLNGGLL